MTTNPWQEATEAIEEFGRVIAEVARDAEAELKRRGIPREYVAPGISSEIRPAIDQLADLERGA